MYYACTITRAPLQCLCVSLDSPCRLPVESRYPHLPHWRVLLARSESLLPPHSWSCLTPSPDRSTLPGLRGGAAVESSPMSAVYSSPLHSPRPSPPLTQDASGPFSPVSKSTFEGTRTIRPRGDLRFTPCLGASERSLPRDRGACETVFR